MTDLRCLRGIIIICSVMVFAEAAAAQGDEATARAMLAKHAGSYDTDALLKEPAVREQLRKLLGAEMNHLEHNLNVKGSVDLNWPNTVG